MTLTIMAIHRRYTLIWLAALVGLASAGRASADEAVSVRHDGAAYVVSAAAVVNVDAETAWHVLTGYDAYASFVPGLRESRTIERAGAHAVVEQRGEFRFMGIGFSLEVRYFVTEQWPHSVQATAIGGSFRTALGRYELMPLDHGTRVVYTGRLEPDFFLPTFVGVRAVRVSAAQQFAAMIAEIERRRPTVDTRSRAYATLD